MPMKNLQQYPWMFVSRFAGCLFFLFAFLGRTAAQNVTIAADKTSDCPPFTVQFTGTADPGYTSFDWDFGVGAHVNDKLSPQRTFLTPQVYHVTLSVVYPTGTVTRSIDITVHNKPTVNFQAPLTAGCVPFTTSFSDMSTPGDGSIKSIDWDFGDGSGASGGNVTHQFKTAGTYNVVSIVTNSFGCRSNSQPVPIKVQDAPQPTFTADKTQSCSAPLTVTFFNTTVNTSTDPYTYQWDYGDGATGTSNVHTYTKAGKYTVVLTATTSANCTAPATKTDYIVIENVKPSFTSDAACTGQDIHFKNTTQPVPTSAKWTFDDGTTQTGIDAVKQLPAGDHTVQLDVMLDNCSATVTQTVHVVPAPVINPVATPVSSCKVPFTTQFNANAANATSWQWNFGDGNTSTLQNPSHTYSAAGAYNVSLTATNGNICTKTVNLPGYINIVLPQVTIQPSANVGCLPLPVDFSALTNLTEPVASWQWDFGDGGTSTQAAPQHIYTTQGTFTVWLKITSASGCEGLATTVVRTGALPVVDFTATPLKSCAIDPIQFTNLSTPRGNAWTWIFPDDNSTETVENPNHKFGQIGKHTVTLIVDNNGCTNTLTKKDYVVIMPPIARFNTAPDCADPYHRKFTDNSDFGADPTLPKKWTWDFGDGNTSNVQSPDHQYAKTGIYQVTLTVDNSLCTSTLKQSVNIIDEKPVIHGDQANICLGNKLNVTLDPLNPGNINEYLWNWGDGQTDDLQGNSFDPAKGMSHQYNKTGIFNISLTITDKNGCTRTAPTIAVTVNGATPDFDFSGRLCKGDTLTFTDKSTVNAGNQIVKWTWNFGDGSTPEIATTQPLNTKHAYTNPNDYTVTLTTLDQFSCPVAVQKTVHFDKLQANFMVPVNIACLHQPFTFVDQSSGTITSYAWDFGDGTTGAGARPSKVYNTPGTYNVTLTVTNANGCTDQITKPSVLRVPDPKAVFTIPANLQPCPPVKVQFTNTSSDYIKAAWDFGDNGTSTKNDPDVHIYTRAKTYTVTLIVYAEGGCADTARQSLTIKGPDGTINTTPTTGCVPLNVVVTANAVKTSSYSWDFDDGIVATTTVPTSPGHTYTKAGIYYPRVTLTDDQGCSVPVLSTDKIIVDQAVADFTVDNTQACGGGIITFKNNSKTLTKDSLALDFKSAWDFGMPGDPANNASTTDGRFNYTVPGTHQVTLKINSAYNCPAQKTLPVVIPPQPQAVIAPIPALCAVGDVQLSGSDKQNLPGTKWSWTLGNGQQYSVQNPPVLHVNQVGAIPVTLTVTNGDGSCPSTATSNIVVNPIPALAPSPATANICRGAGLQLMANSTPDVKVSWTNYNISDPASQTPVVKPDIDTMYKIVATNAYNCTNMAAVKVSVVQPFHIYAQDQEICAGQSIQMNAGGAMHYRWIPARGLNRDDIPNPVASPAGNITYQVVGWDDNGCFADTALARVFVRPAPVIKAGPSVTVPTGTVVPINAQGSNDIVRIQWTPATDLSCTDCLTPTAIPKSDITYLVSVVNQWGCTSSDEISIKLICSSSMLFIPNTFSPNGDGQNDIFYIRGKGVQTVRVFRIFNRWGQMVFERANFNTDDPTFGWDGRFKGNPLNPDVFVYYAEVVCDKGEVSILKGNITLLR
ncbi:PKD domain-containing protein [Chitinophaga vietnamensis]|uniref:PKD domain-containing protein n=1 Tax=Chitinophaga vietnamensis TaxID=2593957 RepID=UPI001177511F|nr:PKD domain-containing protein [Chitinophaga vietnamensis]